MSIEGRWIIFLDVFDPDIFDFGAFTVVGFRFERHARGGAKSKMGLEKMLPTDAFKAAFLVVSASQFH